MSKDKLQRLSQLGRVHPIASVDHRHFLDEDGKDRRLKDLSRADRRKLQAQSKKLNEEYNKVVDRFSKSGAGYPVDTIVRELALEYTARYRDTGIYSQPVSFNYFEAFCNIKLIWDTAPYAEPVGEFDHLFSLVDLFDYITSSNSDGFQLGKLSELPEARAFHYTTNGDINDLTFLTASGREFVVSGFSMVRRGNSIHWYVVGGEVFSTDEWKILSEDIVKVETEHINPYKRAFLSESAERKGNVFGPPVPLEGTSTAKRAIIAGETHIVSEKHLARCLMSETENFFDITCDDPELFGEMMEGSVKNEAIKIMQERVESAAVLWNLAAAMFQLPAYFAYKLRISKEVLVAAGKKLNERSSLGRGIGVQFRKVSAIDVADVAAPVIRAYTLPHYRVETEGYWRRLKDGGYGVDRDGQQIKGKTWIRSSNPWRERPVQSKTIYVKSTLATAKVKIQEFLDLAAHNATISEKITPEKSGVIYVLRCMLMEESVYKVGWTSSTATDRAKELSSSSGIPEAFVVVESWEHDDPEGLEKNIHAMLDGYRLHHNREFFRVSFPALKRIIENEIIRIH